MERNLDEFMKYITIIDKDFSIYKDEEKGVVFPYNTVGLLVKSDYIELDEDKLKAGKFQQKIDDLEYNKIKVKRAIPKNEITGNDEDKYTITEKEVDVYQVWNVSNSIGIYKSFTNKEDAMKMVEDINSNIFKYL